jgi:methionyl-tRNA formyltransferase
MRIVLLTTEAVHHLYFAWRLREAFPLHAILVEQPAPPAHEPHPFEKRRDAFERDTLLRGAPRQLADLAETWTFASVNHTDAVAALARSAADVILVFGTRKLETAVRALAPHCLNLHGGNPEHYRGLDSHLWAIYHQDFANLVTTLHRVDERLDTGEIVLQSQVPLDHSMDLAALRARNTEECVRLSRLALTSLATSGWLPTRRQAQRGRYYSALPAALIERVEKNFARHVSEL